MNFEEIIKGDLEISEGYKITEKDDLYINSIVNKSGNDKNKSHELIKVIKKLIDFYEKDSEVIIDKNIAELFEFRDGFLIGIMGKGDYIIKSDTIEGSINKIHLITDYYRKHHSNTNDDSTYVLFSDNIEKMDERDDIDGDVCDVLQEVMGCFNTKIDKNITFEEIVKGDLKMGNKYTFTKKDKLYIQKHQNEGFNKGENYKSDELVKIIQKLMEYYLEHLEIRNIKYIDPDLANGFEFFDGNLIGLFGNGKFKIGYILDEDYPIKKEGFITKLEIDTEYCLKCFSPNHEITKYVEFTEDIDDIEERDDIINSIDEVIESVMYHLIDDYHNMVYYKI